MDTCIGKRLGWYSLRRGDDKGRREGNEGMGALDSVDTGGGKIRKRFYGCF